MNDIIPFDFNIISANLITLDEYSDREKIEILEWCITENMDNIADDMPLHQWLFGGMYYREMMIPEGCVITGKIHLDAHIFILMKGILSVMTDNGVKMIEAPYTFSVDAGIKKIGYAHNDVICATIHKTDKTSIEGIEDIFFKDSDLEWVDKIMNKQIEGAVW